MQNQQAPGAPLRFRRLFLGSLIGAMVVVVLLSITVLYPRLCPIWKKNIIALALAESSGASFWWPASWRAEYEHDQRFLALLPMGGEFAGWNRLESIELLSTQSISVDRSEGKSRLAIIRTAPEFSLTDQDGKPFRMSDLKGKVALISFIFTTCNGTCPATTHRMSLVQQELKGHGVLKADLVRLLSISLDPVRDTPDVMRRYMTLYDADPKNWSFLTGPVDEVQKVIAAWDMWARPAANGQLDHPSRIFLVDTRGRVREVYNLSFLRPAWVAEDIQLLLDEALR